MELEIKIPELKCECGNTMTIVEQDHKKDETIMVHYTCSCEKTVTAIIEPNKRV